MDQIKTEQVGPRKGVKIFFKVGKPHHFHVYSVYGLMCSIMETKRGFSVFQNS